MGLPAFSAPAPRPTLEIMDAVMDCPFCAIVARRDPSDVAYETANTLAFLPLEGTTQGYTLVIPKRRFSNFLELQPVQFPELGTTMITAAREMREVLRPDGTNLISSAGAVATQTVMHVHFHMVPRWKDDGFDNPWPDRNLSTEKERAEAAAALRAFFDAGELAERNPEW